MKTVTIYGYSDDIVGYESDDMQGDETQAWDNGTDVVFSNGCRVRVTYDDELYWHAELLTPGLCTVYEHTLAEGDDYSDRLTIGGDFQWVEFWSAEGISRGDVVESLVNVDHDEVAVDVMVTALRILRGHSTAHIPKLAAEKQDPDSPVEVAMADSVPLHEIEDALDTDENRPKTEQDMPESHPDSEPSVGPMAAHAEATQTIAERLVDVDDEIAIVIANALDIMGASMVDLSLHPPLDPVTAVTRAMEGEKL